MFENVLVGVDGSSNGRDAMELAEQLAGSAGKLTLVHVRSGELNPLLVATPQLLDEERDASMALLERERADCDVQAELASVVAPGAGSGLHRRAEAPGGDLLGVGSAG